MQIGSVLLRVSLLCCPLWLGGCGTMSASGPATSDIVSAPRKAVSIPYALVRVTPEVTSVLGRHAPRLLTFADRRPPSNLRFGIGDVISVTIFESTAGGLFIPAEAGVRPGNYVTIPNQAVDVNGNVSIPYAGAIRARGRTQVELQHAIVSSLNPTFSTGPPKQRFWGAAGAKKRVGSKARIPKSAVV